MIAICVLATVLGHEYIGNPSPGSLLRQGLFDPDFLSGTKSS